MKHEARVDAQALDDLFAPFDTTSAPGFAVGVAVGGVPLYRRGFGLASIELPVALSPHIRMRIGSTTKHFCALAIMLLQEAGKLSIDESPRVVLPELPAYMDDVTLRQLMSHTSGMRDSLDLTFLTTVPGQPTEPDAQFKLLCHIDSVNFAPGTGWSYNNGGYVLLSLIVERLAGISLGEFLRTRIFERVGMNDTVLRPFDNELLPNSATLHLPDGSGGWTRGVFGPPIMGEGGMASTVDDMLRWLKHITAPCVGSAETWQSMRTPLTTHGYGFGLLMSDHRGLRTISHAGGVVGGSSQMLKVVDCDLDLILMTNGQSTLEMYRLVDEIIDRCIPGLPPASGGPVREPITGTFYSKRSGRTIFLAEHEGQQIATVGGLSVPAKQHDDGSLSVAVLPTDLRLMPVRVDGVTAGLDVTEFGKSERLDLVTAPDDSDSSLPRGQFRNTGSGISAELLGDSLKLTSASGAQTYTLTSIGPDLWKGQSNSVIPISITVEFAPEGFLLSTGRTERLAFNRVG